MYVTVIETSGTASVLVYNLAFRVAVSHEVVSRCPEIIWHVGSRQSASAADKVTRTISKLSLPALQLSSVNISIRHSLNYSDVDFFRREKNFHLSAPRPLYRRCVKKDPSNS